mmetsp:Transcript_15789/g.40571  ORF Transcript_15789/g.40571 Transcript_15789/m.40571 type:complete len:117 (+) Transcript_15789:541-891(+)
MHVGAVDPHAVSSPFQKRTCMAHALHSRPNARRPRQQRQRDPLDFFGRNARKASLLACLPTHWCYSLAVLNAMNSLRRKNPMNNLALEHVGNQANKNAQGPSSIVRKKTSFLNPMS